MLTFVVLQVIGEEGIILGRQRKSLNGLGGDEALMEDEEEEEEEEERPAMAKDREGARVVSWGGEVPELSSHFAGQGSIAYP